MTTHDIDFDNEDLALLSAYLDDALSDVERAQLEKRLAQEPLLKQTLKELQLTIHLLQDLPPVTPPRSFTIDPATVQTGQVGWLRIAAWLRLGSTLAAIVFALTITLEMALFGVGPTVSEEALDGASMPELVLEEAPASDPGAMVEEAPQADSADAVPASEEASGGIMAEEDAVEEEEADAAAGRSTARDDLHNDAEGEFAQDELVAPLDLQPESGEMLSAPPPVQAPPLDDEGALIEEETTVQQPFDRAQTPATDEPIVPLRLVQLLLVVLAIGLGFGSWWMVRRSHQ